MGRECSQFASFFLIETRLFVGISINIFVYFVNVDNCSPFSAHTYPVEVVGGT